MAHPNTGINYTVRRLPDNGDRHFGIVVRVFEHGHLVEEDKNLTPWSSFDRAMGAAKRAAYARSEQTGLPVVGEA